MANTCFTKLSQTIINARLASKQAYLSPFQLHAVGDQFSDGTLMTCIQHDFWLRPSISIIFL